MTKDAKHSKLTIERAALSRWCAPSRGVLALVLLSQLLATCGWIAFAWGVGHAIAAISEKETAVAFIFVALAGAIARALLAWAGETFAVRAGDATVASARGEILDALARASGSFGGGANAGERASQLVDRTARLAGYAANWLPGMRLAVLGPVLIATAVFTQSWLAAVLLFVSVLALPLFIWLTASETAAAARAQQDSLDALAGAFQTRTAHAGLIRAFRAIGRETATLSAAAEDLRTRTLSILRIAFLSTAVLEFFASISIALVAVYVGFKLLGIFPLWTGETISLAQGMTALILAPEFFAPIRRLASLHHDRADGIAAAATICVLIERTPRNQARRLPKLSAAPNVRFTNVSLSHDGNATAVSGLSFEISAGERVALAGPSGSGKTSVLSALLGRCAIVEGHIEVDGVRLAPADSLAESVAFVRQAPWIIEGTISDNIALALPAASRAQIEAAASAAGVLAFAAPDRGGLEMRVERFGSGLSGGQRQRIALARAALRDAPFWLLDEPTAHLGPEGEAEFLSRLPALTRGRTVVIASHSDAVIAACDRAIRLPAITQRSVA